MGVQIVRWLNNRINQHNEWWLPAGKHTKNYGNHHVNRKINYTWQFSIAMLNYQRVAMATTPPPCVVTLLLRYSPFQHPSLRRSMLANHVTDYREENSISVHHFNVFHDEGLLTMKKCHLYPFITHGFAPYSLLTLDIFWKTTVLRGTSALRCAVACCQRCPTWPDLFGRQKHCLAARKPRGWSQDRYWCQFVCSYGSWSYLTGS